MGEETVALILPAGLYAKLEELAADSDSTPVDQIATFNEDTKSSRPNTRICIDSSVFIPDSFLTHPNFAQDNSQTLFDAPYSNILVTLFAL